MMGAGGGGCWGGEGTDGAGGTLDRRLCSIPPTPPLPSSLCAVYTSTQPRIPFRKH